MVGAVGAVGGGLASCLLSVMGMMSEGREWRGREEGVTRRRRRVGVVCECDLLESFVARRCANWALCRCGPCCTIDIVCVHVYDVLVLITIVV